MITPKRISLVLAATLVASLLVFMVATLNIGDRRKLKPDAAELDLLRAQGSPKEERGLEDKLPKYLPIKVKLRTEKEKAFKDLDNDNWIRDLEVEVKNTGTRPIYYMVLLVDMPELKFGAGNMIFDLRFGDKKFMNFASGAKPEDLSLKPGEACILNTRTALDWNEYNHDMHWPKPKHLVLKLQEISFGDGTGFRSSYDGPWPPPVRVLLCAQEPKQPRLLVGLL